MELGRSSRVLNIEVTVSSGQTMRGFVDARVTGERSF
jgi:hypothetical protein